MKIKLIDQSHAGKKAYGIQFDLDGCAEGDADVLSSLVDAGKAEEVKSKSRSKAKSSGE